MESLSAVDQVHARPWTCEDPTEHKYASLSQQEHGVVLHDLSGQEIPAYPNHDVTEPGLAALWAAAELEEGSFRDDMQEVATPLRVNMGSDMPGIPTQATMRHNPVASGRQSYPPSTKVVCNRDPRTCRCHEICQCPHCAFHQSSSRRIHGTSECP